MENESGQIFCLCGKRGTVHQNVPTENTSQSFGGSSESIVTMIFQAGGTGIIKLPYLKVTRRKIILFFRKKTFLF